jgi:hypothetical protein
MRPEKISSLALPDADAAGQALGAGKARGDAQRDFGLAELCLLRGQDHIAGHGQLAAATQGEAVHCGDGGDLQLLNAAHQGAAAAAPVASAGQVQRALLADVGAGHEGAALAGDDQSAELLVLLHLGHQLLQLADNGGIQGVERLRTVDRRDADALIFLITNGRVHCKCPPHFVLFPARRKARQFPQEFIKQYPCQIRFSRFSPLFDFFATFSMNYPGFIGFFPLSIFCVSVSYSKMNRKEVGRFSPQIVRVAKAFCLNAYNLTRKFYLIFLSIQV